MGWQNGRQLASATNGTNSLSFEYDVNGIRTSKTINGVKHTYLYNGTQLVSESFGNTRYEFRYDANGAPFCVLVYNNNAFALKCYYLLNLQGDVVGLMNSAGAMSAYYTYDAWGNVTSVKSASGTELPESHFAYDNPLLYRGYYYDRETTLYYCQSRYYDPEVGRFINPDSAEFTAMSTVRLNDTNLFAYCGSNPVVRADKDGKLWDYVLDIGFLAWSIADVAEDPSDLKNWGALIVDAVFAVIPFVPSGAGQVLKIGNRVDDAADIANTINRMEHVKNTEKITMIGRNMERVTRAASGIGKADNLYKVWNGYNKVASFSKPLANALSAAHNGLWLFNKLRTGYTIIDIGLSTLHQSRGLWYGTERLVMGLWETRNIWKFAIN